MNKKNIVIVINDLGIGGAEKLLIDLLPDLDNIYNVILVTLSDKKQYTDRAIASHKNYSLGFTSRLSMIRCVYRLRKIIKKYNPILVQSHLFYSNIISRLACPKNIPCLNTIHALSSDDVFDGSRVWTFLEKCTIKQYHSILAVSQHILDDYEHVIGKVRKSFVLSNFVGDEFFRVVLPDKNFASAKPLKLVAVGNIKPVKNYIYLIEVFKHLKEYDISLDIYGSGGNNLVQSFEKIIAEHNLPVHFKGHANNIDKLLPQYDLYVMPSISEGCSIAVMEAMVLGLPLLLSDLPGLRAETMNNALFFDISNQPSFINRIEEIISNKYDLHLMSVKGIAIARENYTKKNYLKKLLTIYDQIILANKSFEETL